MRAVSAAVLTILAGGLLAARPVPFANAVGITVTIEAEGTPGGDGPGRLTAALVRMGATLGTVTETAPPTSATGPQGTFTTVGARFVRDPGFVHILLTNDRGGAVCHARVPTIPAAKDPLTAAMQRCGVELARQAPVTRPAPPPVRVAAARAPAATPAQAPGRAAAVPTSPGRYPGNWTGVEGVYFHAQTGIGVGGMVMPKFEPVVLFKDGSYYEVDDAPLEDIDLAADRRAHPTRWGRWTRQGTTFTLTDSKGRADSNKLQDGVFFLAYAAAPGTMLADTYDSVGGGGNSALGGEMTIMVSSKRAFAADGRFSAGQSVGAIGSGDVSGVMTSMGSRKSMPVPGRYTLGRHTLEMRFPDGRTERRFFAFASRKSPPEISRDMIFIGDTAYLSD